MKEKLIIVVPAYNEQEVLDNTILVLCNILKDLIQSNIISQDSKLLFVDDGSSDNTWKIIKDNSLKNNLITGISFSKNEGHQKALLAGLLKSLELNADITISLDADLQDDPNVIKEMVKQYQNGFDIVYGVRNSRKKDSFLKRITALTYYRFLKLMGVELVYNHADFRLLSKRCIECLKQYNEKNLYLRGIIPQLGFNSTKVYYQRDKRKAGKSKYSIKKMFTLANDGITSFSLKPLNFIKFLGFIFLLGGLISIICCAILIPNIYYSLIISSCAFLTGVLLFALGIIGNYLGKQYIEVKNRPLYFIKEDITK